MVNTMSVTTIPASLTVAGGSSPTPIGIAAPADTLYSASKLRVTVTGLPSDGNVFLADGLSPVTTGQSLTAAQLTGLKFAPDSGVVAQSSLFSYTVTDP